MTITFDKAVYVNLLADFVPEVITSEAEYDRALAIAEPLVANRNLSNEESKFLSLIVTLIEDYEGKHYPMSDVSPHAALLHLMEYSGTFLIITFSYDKREATRSGVSMSRYVINILASRDLTKIELLYLNAIGIARWRSRVSAEPTRS